MRHLDSAELQGKRILVVHDHFGALSTALEAFDLTSYTDSYLSFESIRLNSEGRISPITEIDQLEGAFDIALLRVSKNMSYFEDILCHLSQHLHADSKVICGYMIKHQAKASFENLNRVIGSTKTSLAWKKARLIFAGFEREPRSSPYPLHIRVEGFRAPFINHSRVFSREKLDIGTRFFLENIPAGDYPVILDLGCGNGIVGIAAKELNPRSKIVFTDESRMAIQSATLNYRNFNPSDEAITQWTHCYADRDPGSVNLVLCNPPFHQDNARDDFTAREMFFAAHRALCSGGVLRVIGNTHLRYPVLLKQIFGNSKIVATHRKFVVADAMKK